MRGQTKGVGATMPEVLKTTSDAPNNGVPSLTEHRGFDGNFRCIDHDTLDVSIAQQLLCTIAKYSQPALKSK